MDEKLRKIINHYGMDKQLKYFQSEVFELNEAIIAYNNIPEIIICVDNDFESDLISFLILKKNKPSI